MSVPQAAVRTPRATSLDALRGLCLVAMAINHVPSELRVLTDQPLGFASAAEGFVFLSGLMAGYIYCRRARTGGVEGLARAAFARSLAIYRAHALCLLAVFVWSRAFGSITGSPAPGAPALFSEQPISGLAAGLMMVYQPGLLDILPIYVGLFLILPWLVRALVAGHVRGLLASSVAIWLATGLWTPPAAYINGVINTGSINFSAWQLLFVIGLIVGHRWSEREARHALATPPSAAPSALLLGTALSVLLCLTALRHGLLPLPAEWLEPLTNKANLGPLRILSLVALAYLLAWSARRWPRAFKIRPLVYLGRNSLSVFSAHVVAACVILAFPDALGDSVTGRLLGVALLLGAMFSSAAVSARAKQPGLAAPMRSVAN